MQTYNVTLTLDLNIEIHAPIVETVEQIVDSILEEQYQIVVDGHVFNIQGHDVAGVYDEDWNEIIL